MGLGVYSSQRHPYALRLAPSRTDSYITFCYHYDMSHGRNLAIIAASLVLAACASPTVDTSAPTFDETKYSVALDGCRGGTVIDATLYGLAGAAIGSAYGAFNGVQLGALSGNSSEGAAIGAIVGNVNSSGFPRLPTASTTTQWKRDNGRKMDVTVFAVATCASHLWLLDVSSGIRDG